jgi:hypothetical protein
MPVGNIGSSATQGPLARYGGATIGADLTKDLHHMIRRRLEHFQGAQRNQGDTTPNQTPQAAPYGMRYGGPGAPEALGRAGHQLGDVRTMASAGAEVGPQRAGLPAGAPGIPQAGQPMARPFGAVIDTTATEAKAPNPTVGGQVAPQTPAALMPGQPLVVSRKAKFRQNPNQGTLF